VATELGTAYVSIVAETSKLEAGVKAALDGSGKHADIVGKDIGKRISETAAKAMKDGWRPDKNLMDGIPDTKLDRIGAHIGQVIGKGVVVGLKANQLGKEFGGGFSDGAKSVGLGKVLAGWKSELSGGGLAALGRTAGKGLMMGFTGAAAVGAAGIAGVIGTAITGGFDRLLTIDKSKQKLKALGKSTAEVADIVKTVTDSVTGTPFSLDQAFATAVQAIGAGTTDIKRFMTDVADAAGFAGTDIDRMGLIFNQIQAKGKLTGEEMMQLMEAGLPAKSWIQQSYNMTADQFDKMQKDGEITLDMLQKSIEDHAPGMGKALGDSLSGSIDGMKTAVARLGADFLAAIFGGDASKATDTMADSIQKITDKLNDMDAWVKAHGPGIQQTFKTIGTVVGGVFTEMSKTISQFMSDVKLLATGLADLVGYAAGFDEFMAKFGLGDQDKGTSLRNLQNSLLQFGNPNPAGQQGGGPNASRERRGLPPVVGSNDGLKPNAINLKDSIAAAFPQITNIGGYRANDPYPDHPSGRALDIMIPPELVGTEAGKALGDQITQYALNSGLAQYALWQQQNWKPGQAPTGMENRGSATENHMDHVHVYTAMQAMNSALSGGMGSAPSPVQGGAPAGGDLLKRLAGLGATYDTGGWLPNGTQVVTNATGKPELILNPDQQQKLVDQGVDPAALLHGGSNGAAPGPMQPNAPVPGEQGQGDPNYGMDFVRSLGFIPAAAGSSGVAGTSSLSKYINMGNSVVSGLIDTGVNLANTAVSAAIAAGAAAGSFGSAAAAAPAGQLAASYGLQLLGNQGKTISKYWFGLAGIGADAAMETLSPFGMPRWLGYDYTSFAPQLGVQEAALSTVEKMGGDAIGKAFAPNAAAGGPAPMAGPAAPIPVQSRDVNLDATGPSSTSEAPPPPLPTPKLPIPGLFDEGGMLPPGGIGINMTARPEPVLTPQQWDAMMASPANSQGGAPLVQNLYAQDMQDAIRQLDKVKRRDMMQYAGRP